MAVRPLFQALDLHIQGGKGATSCQVKRLLAPMEDQIGGLLLHAPHKSTRAEQHQLKTVCVN